MTDFDKSPGGSPEILERIEHALKVRARIPLAAEADAAQPLLPAPTWEVTLENIGLDGLYRVLLIAVQDDQVKLLTNFTLRPGVSPYLGAPATTLVAYTYASQQLADAIASRLSAIQFDNGPGGPPSARDGAVHFLKIRSLQQTTATALYFYQYPATSGHWQTPSGADSPRWDAIRGVYEIWREIVTHPAVKAAP